MNTFTVILAISYAIANKILQCSGLEDYLKSNNKTKTFSKSILVVLVLIIMGFVVVLITIPFGIFKFFLSIYLKIVHKEDFGGFLNGIGASFAMQNEQTYIITVLIVDYDDDIEGFYKELKKIVEITVQDFDQLNSIVQKSYGYYYLLKNQITFDKILSRITLNQQDNEKNILSFDTILNYVDSIRSYDYKDQLFQVVLFNHPVWFSNKRNYAIFLKTNHCILDGMGFLSVITKHLSKPNKDVVVKKLDLVEKYKKLNIDYNKCYLTKNSFGFTTKNDLNENYKQFSAYIMEDSPDLKEKIKFISQKLSVRFNQVVLAGLIYSISKILDKKNIKSGPFNISITASSDIKQIENVMNGDSDSIKNVKNAFFVSQVTVMKCRNRSKREFLIETGREVEEIKQSVNPLLNMMFFNYLSSFMPSILWRAFLMEQNRRTHIVLTNILDHPTERIVCGRKMYAIFTIVGNTGNKCIFFMHGSYANRFGICMSGRYEFIKSRDDVQFILHETRKFMEDVFNELNQEKK
nr:uncharacterized protein LOC111428113 [Onthophagus taurus]XP_022919281.1 uncharacterized protein LOC111428113 [Onthophagus taurus]